MKWIKIFSTEAEAKNKIIPDKPQLLIIHGKRICLVYREGQFFAIQDSCSHNGESLSKGNVNYLGEIVCPWHNYRFALNTGKASDSNSTDLATYPIKIDESGFFIAI